MSKKKCALSKGVTKRSIQEESLANWVLENRLNGLTVPRNSVRLFALKWSKMNAFSCYPTMKVHKSEANPQVYVETPLHPEKLTVWCALWAGGILHQKR
ncbi:hypothetical protein TNCV_4305671 [Trichonephila clavipes]|nr:hypothetical protein TNCV_4305671 [Trichonephila clavipes]